MESHFDPAQRKNSTDKLLRTLSNKEKAELHFKR